MLKKAITSVGIQRVAEKCNVSTRAVYKWVNKGVLPRTDFTGETRYAEIIAELSQGEFTKDDLLSLPR